MRHSTNTWKHQFHRVYFSEHVYFSSYNFAPSNAVCFYWVNFESSLCTLGYGSGPSRCFQFLYFPRFVTLPAIRFCYTIFIFRSAPSHSVHSWGFLLSMIKPYLSNVLAFYCSFSQICRKYLLLYRIVLLCCLKVCSTPLWINYIITLSNKRQEHNTSIQSKAGMNIITAASGLCCQLSRLAFSPFSR